MNRLAKPADGLRRLGRVAAACENGPHAREVSGSDVVA